MRIVHIITRLIVGGAQENTLLSCEGQHQHGHEVTLMTGPALGPEGSLMERAKRGGYRVETVEGMRRAIGPGKDWGTYRYLVERLREIGPEVVHTHSSKAGILGRRAAKAAGVKVIVHTIHGLAFTASKWGAVNWAYRMAERRAAKWTNKIVCVADAMREQSLAGGVGRAEQYVTVYSGMETGAFLRPPVGREEVRGKLGLKEGDLAVGTIARLFELKGHEDLLELAPEVCRRHPEVRFLWVGDGILRSEFEKRMERMGLRDRFILTGLVEPGRIAELAGAMDVVVHPSRREGLARALVQGALACKPVISYDIDGNREAMIDGQSGFLIPAFDKTKFLQKMENLIRDGELRRLMGEAGREFALGRFDAEVMVEALEKVYRGEMGR